MNTYINITAANSAFSYELIERHNMIIGNI